MILETPASRLLVDGRKSINDTIKKTRSRSQRPRSFWSATRVAAFEKLKEIV